MDSFLTLFDLVGSLARRRYQAAERHFSALGLNHTEARLLTLLQESGGSAAQEALSALIFIDRSNAGRALKKLEQENHIRRRRHAEDKRAHVVQITAKGRKAAAEIGKVKKKMAQDFFGNLRKDEAETLITLLRKAGANAENG